jgi:anti-sigma B factor antagonist
MTAQIHRLELERSDKVAVAVLSGEVDLSNATHVRQRIAEFVIPDDDALVLDLSALSFIDSAGLSAVFQLSATLDEKGQRLLLIVPQGSQVERTIEVVGMPRTISVHRDRATALETAREGSTEARPPTPSGEA